MDINVMSVNEGSGISPERVVQAFLAKHYPEHSSEITEVYDDKIGGGWQVYVWVRSASFHTLRPLCLQITADGEVSSATMKKTIQEIEALTGVSLDPDAADRASLAADTRSVLPFKPKE